MLQRKGRFLIRLSSSLGSYAKELRYTKRTAYETMGESVVYPSKGWEILEEYEKVTQNSEDEIEGATAFAERREPVWRGC